MTTTNKTQECIIIVIRTKKIKTNISMTKKKKCALNENNQTNDIFIPLSEHGLWRKQ